MPSPFFPDPVELLRQSWTITFLPSCLLGRSKNKGLLGGSFKADTFLMASLQKALPKQQQNREPHQSAKFLRTLSLRPAPKDGWLGLVKVAPFAVLTVFALKKNPHIPSPFWPQVVDPRNRRAPFPGRCELLVVRCFEFLSTALEVCKTYEFREELCHCMSSMLQNSDSHRFYASFLLEVQKPCWKGIVIGKQEAKK